jgi:ABC-type lipopolysaccharide export system ATPase subunit
MSRLSLGAGPLTDDDLAKIVRLCPNLEGISANGGVLTAAGISHLASLRKLESISLAGGRGCGFDALKAIATLPKLIYLNLPDSDIDDNSIAGLNGLRGQLFSLDVGGSRITDRSIPSLIKLRPRATLTVSGSGMTPAGIDELRSKLGSSVE